MKKILALLFLLAASNAQAQTNSCDKPVLTGNIVVSSTTFLFTACPIATDDADGIVVELDGVKTPFTMAPSGPANAVGRVPFNVQVIIPSNGNHTVRTAPFTLSPTGVRQEGPFSSPFVLVFAKATPTTATTNHPR